MRRIVLAGLLVLTGCSISSTVNPPKGMTCVKAHDANDTVHCDLYLPTPLPTPTVTVTATVTAKPATRSYIRPRRTTATPAIPAVWTRLVACEASGDWHYGGPDGHTDPGYDFEGGPNFAHSTWLAYRPVGYPLHAYDATPAQQVRVARAVLAAQGVRAWPVCGPRVHLQPGD